MHKLAYPALEGASNVERSSSLCICTCTLGVPEQAMSDILILGSEFSCRYCTRRYITCQTWRTWDGKINVWQINLRGKTWARVGESQGAPLSEILLITVYQARTVCPWRPLPTPILAWQENCIGCLNITDCQPTVKDHCTHPSCPLRPVEHVLVTCHLPYGYDDLWAAAVPGVDWHRTQETTLPTRPGMV